MPRQFSLVCDTLCCESPMSFSLPRFPCTNDNPKAAQTCKPWVLTTVNKFPMTEQWDKIRNDFNPILDVLSQLISSYSDSECVTSLEHGRNMSQVQPKPKTNMSASMVALCELPNRKGTIKVETHERNSNIKTEQRKLADHTPFRFLAHTTLEPSLSAVLARAPREFAAEIFMHQKNQSQPTGESNNILQHSKMVKRSWNHTWIRSKWHLVDFHAGGFLCTWTCMSYWHGWPWCPLA